MSEQEERQAILHDWETSALTQQQIAAKRGISQGQVSKIINGASARRKHWRAAACAALSGIEDPAQFMADVRVLVGWLRIAKEDAVRDGRSPGCGRWALARDRLAAALKGE